MSYNKDGMLFLVALQCISNSTTVGFYLHYSATKKAQWFSFKFFDYFYKKHFLPNYGDRIEENIPIARYFSAFLVGIPLQSET